MKCDKCGGELIEGKKFCTSCGAPVAAEPESPESTTEEATPAVPPAPPAAQAPKPAPVAPVLAPPAAGKGMLRGRSRGWTALAIGLVVLIVAGIVVAIVLVAFPNKPVAKISSLAVTRKDGKTLNLKKVPLGVDLVLTATFNAKYGKGGRGSIKLYLESSTGEEIIGKTFQVKSKDGAQTQAYKVYMTLSSGKPVEAKAKLDVSSGSGEKVSAQASTSFTAEEGSIEGSDSSGTSLDETRKRVESEFSDLMTTAKTAIAAGIDITDLQNRIADLGVKVVGASTVEELESAEVEIENLQKEIQSRMATD
jgi:hypothetical protein